MNIDEQKYRFMNTDTRVSECYAHAKNTSCVTIKVNCIQA